MTSDVFTIYLVKGSLEFPLRKVQAKDALCALSQHVDPASFVNMIVVSEDICRTILRSANGDTKEYMAERDNESKKASILSSGLFC